MTQIHQVTQTPLHMNDHVALQLLDVKYAAVRQQPYDMLMLCSQLVSAAPKWP